MMKCLIFLLANKVMARSSMPTKKEQQEILEHATRVIFYDFGDCCLSVFPYQVMFLGVVAKPIPAEGFDGKIFLGRVAESGEYLQTTYNQRFSDHAGIKWQLRQNEWIKLLTY